MPCTLFLSLKMLYSREYFLATTIVLIFLVSPIQGQRLRHGKRSDIECGPNYYIGRTSSGNVECIQCPRSCDPGTTIVTQCGFGRPQTCRPCEPTPGKTCTSGVERRCILCAVYGRSVEVECNIYNQTVCGGCQPGYYENLDDAKFGHYRYCRKCKSADSWRQQCQSPLTAEPVTPSTPAERISQQMSILYATVVTQLEEKLSTSKTLLQRLRQTTKATKEAADGFFEWRALVAGLATTFAIILLFVYLMYRYLAHDDQGDKTTEIELEEVVDSTEEGVKDNPVCADAHHTEYDRLVTQGKEAGKDMSIQDCLTVDMQQAIAMRINQRPAYAGDYDYRNVFTDLGLGQDIVAAANATGIDDPSDKLFRVLLTQEIKMSDIITTLDKYKFYDLVKDICKEIIENSSN